MAKLYNSEHSILFRPWQPQETTPARALAWLPGVSAAYRCRQPGLTETQSLMLGGLSPAHERQVHKHAVDHELDGIRPACCTVARDIVE